MKPSQGKVFSILIGSTLLATAASALAVAAPTISTSQDTFTVTAGENVTFSATALDLDGDLVSLEVSNLADFPGATFTEISFDLAFLLDTYPDAVAAYSLRQLSSTYTGPALDVRRVSDSATATIEFENSVLDTATLETFSQDGDVEVTKWYSQVEGVPHLVPTGNGPLIVEAGSVIRESRTDKPRLKGRGGSFISETSHSSVFEFTGTPMVLTEWVNRAASPGNVVLFGPSHLGDNTSNDVDTFLWKGSGRLDFGKTNGDNINSTRLTKEWAWVGALVGSSSQKIMVGPNQDGSTAVSVIASNKTKLMAYIGEDVRLGELLFWPQLDEEEYRNRLWAADRYWDATIPESQFAEGSPMRQHLWWQGQIRDWIGSLTVEDVTLETTVQNKDAGSNSIVVANADWGHLPANHEIGIGNQTYTLSGAPASDGTITTIAVSGDISNVAIGDQVVFKPYWDGTYPDVDTLAELWSEFQQDGDSRRNFGLNGRGEPEWYVLDSGGSDLTPTVSKIATISEAAPEIASSGNLEIDETADARTFAFFEIDISGLSQEPAAVDISITGTSLGDDDSVKPYVGAKVFADASFDPSTATWNNAPADLTSNPAFDDIEGLDDGETSWQLSLTDEIRAAYSAGASSVLVGLYNVNQQYNSTSTNRTITIADAPVVTLHQGKGIEATGVVRVPDIYEDVYNYGMGREVAWWAQRSLPTAGGTQGNPFYGSEALKRRALVVDGVNMIMLPSSGNIYVWTQYIGGYIWSAAETVHWAGSVLDDTTREAFKHALLHYAERCDEFGPVGQNTNLDIKCIQGMAAAHELFDDSETEAQTRFVEASKRVLFSDRNGDPSTTESVWHLEGNIYEGRTPEGSYNNRSVTHLVGARVWTYGDPDWSWLDTVLVKEMEWMDSHIVPEPDGSGADSSGWSGRTIDAVLGGQWIDAAKRTLGVLYEEGRFWLKNWRETGSTTVPDAAGLSSGLQTYVNNLSTMTTDTSLPPQWAGKSSWPGEIPYAPPVSDWYNTVRSYYTSDVAALYPSSYAASTESNYIRRLPATSGAEDWTAVRQGDVGSDRWGAFIEHLRRSGAYSGYAGGMLHQFWTEDAGSIIRTLRTGQEWATIETWSAEHVWGRNAAGTKAFSFAFPNERDHTVTVGSDYSEIAVNGQFLEEQDNVSPLSADAAWTQTKRYTVLNETDDGKEGLKVDLTLEYTAGAGGADQLTELYWSLPLHVGKRGGASVSLAYWSGSSWVTVPQDSWNSATNWRISRDLNDGQGARDVWLELESATSVRLNRATRTTSSIVTQNMDIELHPTGNGTAQNIPNQITRSLILTATDPNLVSTTIANIVNYPEQNDVLPQGEVWAIQSTATAPEGVTLSNLLYEYSTDYAGDQGAATWTTIASLDSSVGGTITDNEDGSYEYIGDDVAIPAGLTAMRARSVSATADEQTYVAVLSSASPSEVAHENFDAADGTLLDTTYVLDSGQTISGYNNGAQTSGGEMAGRSGANFTWGQSWWTDVNSQNQVVKGTFSFNGAGAGSDDAGNSLYLRSQLTGSNIYHLNVRAKIYSSGIEILQQGGPTSSGTAHSFNTAESYVVKAQVVGETAVMSVYDSTETTLLVRTGVFGITRTTTGAGVSLRSSTLSWDNWHAYTW